MRNLHKRRKTPSVPIGSITIGSAHPIAIQSMTDTPTADVAATLQQTVELVESGAELVRWTVNDERAAQAVPEIIRGLKDQGYTTPIIGDFHFNGHRLLLQYPHMAQALAKYRINPGNIGKAKQHDENFRVFVQIAKKYNKPVRIGVNWGSLDEEVFTKLMSANARQRHPKNFEELTHHAMVQSALQSANYAVKLGLKPTQIVLSVKMSRLPDMVAVYELLAKKCNFALHLGLTEAGTDVRGIVSSSAALAILLRQGIGDTIRVSLTPQPGVSRTREVDVCKDVLQSLEDRFFHPTIISCPGCGRTNREYFQKLSDKIRAAVRTQSTVWQKKYPGVERLKIAIMGCVVNGPGESRHADIGISLPGAGETIQAPVYIDGKKSTVLKGDHIANEFLNILTKYIQQKFST